MKKLWERARSHRRGRGATEEGAEPQERARSHRGRRGATGEGAEPQGRRGATGEARSHRGGRGATGICVESESVMSEVMLHKKSY